jgi:hypothetical protein
MQHPPIEELKPMLLGTFDDFITRLQGDGVTPDVDWQMVMIARECVVSCTTEQLVEALDRADEKNRHIQSKRAII